MNFAESCPTSYETWITLNDGKTVYLRPIMDIDENLVMGFFARLSPESIYLRFLNQLRVLPEGLLYRFTHLDYSTQFALAGTIQENGTEAIIAIARYAYCNINDATDLAITVRDDWQHLGLGKLLLKRVVDIAKENGIFRFNGIIHPQNKRIMRILTELGYEVKYFLNEGFFQVEIYV